MKRRWWLAVLWLAGFARGEGDHWARIARRRLKDLDAGRRP